MVKSIIPKDFERWIITDAISQSSEMNSKFYYIGRRYSFYDDKLSNCYNIELNLRDNRPLLSFTYQAKAKYNKEWNIK